jgi:small subunit ribosomal protein S21
MRKDREKAGLTVQVRNNDINGALRVLKKRLQTEGVLNEIRERKAFRSKGEKKRLAAAAGRRRWMKKIDKLKETGQWND